MYTLWGIRDCSGVDTRRYINNLSRCMYLLT